MILKKISERAMGTPVEGIEIRLTTAEAKLVHKILCHGAANPPRDRSGNSNYEEQETARQLAIKMEETWKIQL
jgi:hypothetical protein